MLPATLEGLAVVLVAVVPGYIAVTLWARTKTWERPRTDLTLVLLALIFSAVTHALLFPLTVLSLWPIRDHLIEHPWRLGVWAVLALVVIPALVGVYAGRISDLLSGVRSIPQAEGAWWRELFPPPHEVFVSVAPTAWDKFIRQKIPWGKIVIVTFEDGKHVAGSYYQGGFALTTPQKQGIFLNREWTVDEHGNLGRPVPFSRGVLIPTTATIKHIRVVDRDLFESKRREEPK